MTVMQRCFVMDWSNVSRWDLKGARAARFRLLHPDYSPMATFAEEVTELVRPSDQPEKDWPVYGVNNRDGVFFSHHRKGSEFNSAYKRIRADWFFHNPTRANVGSLGRVPSVPDDAITSPEYQVWRITDGLLPEFVEILLRTRFFLDLVQIHRTGAVKERLFVQNLLEIPIPLLNAIQQQHVVSTWREALKSLTQIDGEMVRVRREIDDEFFAALGLNRPPERQLPRVLSARWQDVRRWGVRYNQLLATGADISVGRYPAVELGDMLDVVQYGTSEKGNEDGEGTSVLRINNIKDRGIDTTDLKHVPLAESTRKGLLLEDGDILIIRTSGSRDLVGTCAVFHELGDYVYASYLIRLRVKPGLEPDYVNWYLNSVIGRQQVDLQSRQIMQNNINSEEIRALQIPQPKPAEQRAMVKKIREGVARIARLQEERARRDERVRGQVEGLILTGVLDRLSAPVQ
jgi:type I restriction enzyme, S subunit